MYCLESLRLLCLRKIEKNCDPEYIRGTFGYFHPIANMFDEILKSKKENLFKDSKYNAQILKKELTEKAFKEINSKKVSQTTMDFLQTEENLIYTLADQYHILVDYIIYVNVLNIILRSGKKFVKNVLRNISQKIFSLIGIVIVFLLAILIIFKL